MTTKLRFTCTEVATLASTVDFLQRWGFSLVDESFTVEVEVATEDEQPCTVVQWLLHLLQISGPQSTATLWAQLRVVNKAPANPQQLSAVLSRMKKAGQIMLNRRIWSLTQQNTTP